MPKIRKVLFVSIKFLLFMTVLLGIIYPLTVVMVGQPFFSWQASGSVIEVATDGGETMHYGSYHLGQVFQDKKYLIGRPTDVSQLAPNSPEAKNIIAERVQWWQRLSADKTTPVPAELVVASASGMDPYISPEAARYQVKRLAKERKMSELAVQAIIDKYTSKRVFSFLGQPHVHVLSVNLALDGKIK